MPIDRMTSRDYGGADDLHKIQAFTADAVALAGDCGYLHVGDFPHRLYNVMRMYNPHEIVRLWEDAKGELLAWALVYPRFAAFDAQVHPDHRGSELEEQVIDWAEGRTRVWMRQTGHQGPIETDVFDCDIIRTEILGQRGYACRKHMYTATVCSLAEPLPNVPLPDGFTIRHAAGEHEASKLADVHRGSFGTDWTPEEYRRVMQSPGYRTERELVVVAPNGHFAAFCIYWPDMVNKTGLFEPVGAHSDFRRMGLTRALLYEGLRRMKEKGIETAIVWHEADNEAAQALYTSVGFRPKHKIYTYIVHTSGT